MSDVVESTNTAQIARRGIQDTQDFINLCEAVIKDLADERITPQRANSMMNAGGKMIKAAELQMKYGTKAGARPALRLAAESNGDGKDSTESHAGVGG